MICRLIRAGGVKCHFQQNPREMSWNRKYRERKSPRTKGWDYGQTAAYFVTICTDNRKLCFGDIHNGIMGLSHMGLVANWVWLQIPQQFSHVELDEYIVMPNHVHGILTIYDNRDNDRGDDRGDNRDDHRDAINRVPINRVPVNRDPRNERDDTDLSIKPPGGATGRYNPMLSDGNLGRVLRWYKGRCTYEIHQRNYPDFHWQGRYWDHIIQDNSSLDHIREYIYNNPLNWKSDRFYED